MLHGLYRRVNIARESSGVKMQQLLAILLAVLVTAVVAEYHEKDDVVDLAEDFVSWLKNQSDFPILDKKVRNINTI